MLHNRQATKDLYAFDTFINQMVIISLITLFSLNGKCEQQPWSTYTYVTQFQCNKLCPLRITKCSKEPKELQKYSCYLKTLIAFKGIFVGPKELIYFWTECFLLLEQLCKYVFIVRIIIMTFLLYWLIVSGTSTCPYVLLLLINNNYHCSLCETSRYLH